jgi:hypothetical protein
MALRCLGAGAVHPIIADGLRASGLQTKLDELEARKVVLEKEVAAAPTSASWHIKRRPLFGAVA